LSLEPFPVWLGVGGSPESVVRAARHGFGLMLAIIGGHRLGSAHSRSSTPRRSKSSATATPRRRPLARARGRQWRAGARRALAALSGRAHSGRQGTRLGAAQQGPVPPRPRSA